MVPKGKGFSGFAGDRRWRPGWGIFGKSAFSFVNSLRLAKIENLARSRD
ncbi:MAG TPA: hypothetical protein VJ985_00150 [Gammaproteobacteria bacterium]|nr:hypothetical protein [Gammaproteobacteria bacterium]